MTWKKPISKLATWDNLVVIGGSNTGKSTFCNYILNKMANEGVYEAYYLEADCGQPNFSILPGQLSLVKLSIKDSVVPEI